MVVFVCIYWYLDIFSHLDTKNGDFKVNAVNGSEEIQVL